MVLQHSESTLRTDVQEKNATIEALQTEMKVCQVQLLQAHVNNIHCIVTAMHCS